MEQQILSISLKEYKREIDDLRASLLSLEKGSEEYAKTVNEIKSKQQSLNEVMSIGKKDTDALEGSYNALQQQMSALQKEWKATNDEAKRNELGHQISEIKEQLKGLDASVGDFQRNVGNYAIAGESMKSQMRGLKEEIAMLLAQGLEPTDAKIQELVKSAGKLDDAIKDADAMIKQAANDTSALATMVDVAKTGTAVFGAWQGAMSAFGIESEETAKAIQKLQGIMTMLNSLQTIQTALVDKSSATYQLWNKALAAVGLTSKSAATGTKVLTEAEKENAVAAEAAAGATTKFNKALSASVIGAILVVLATLIAYWDDIKNLLPKVTSETEDYSDAVEHLKDIQGSYNQQIDNEVKLMKAQGASEKQIIEYKIKQTQALQNEIQMKILDIRTTNKQLQSLNAYQLFAAKAFKKILQAATLAYRGIATLSDKVFGTNLVGGLDKMINNVTNGFSKLLDIADGKKVAENNKIIEELEAQLGGVNQQLINYSVDLEVANIQGDKTKKTTKELNKELDNEIDLLKRENDLLEAKIAHENKIKQLKGQLTDLESLEEEEKYYKRQITLWTTIAEKYQAMMKKYKEGSKERLDYEKKYQDALKQITTNTYNLEVKVVEKEVARAEEYLKKLEKTHNQTLYDIRREAEFTIENLGYRFDALLTGIETDIDKFPREFEETLKKLVNEDFKGKTGISIYDLLFGKGEEANIKKIEAQQELNKIAEDISRGLRQGADESMSFEESMAEKLIELEIYKEQILFERRKAARDKEREEVDAYYLDLIEKAQTQAEQEELLAENNKLINELWLEDLEDRANHYLAQHDRMMAKETQHNKHLKDATKKQISYYQELNSSIANLMGSIGDIMEENIKRKQKNGEIDAEEAEKEFQRVKAMQISVTWLNTLAGAAGALLQGIANYPPPYGAILGGISAAAAMAAGIAQTMQISNTEFGQGGSGSAPTAEASVSDIQVSPLLNQEVDANQMTALNTEQLTQQQSEQRVWISQTDLTKSSNQVSVRQTTTKF